MVDDRFVEEMYIRTEAERTDCGVSTVSVNYWVYHQGSALSLFLFVVVLDVGLLDTSRQVTRATHVRNRVCPLVELILKIIIILLIIFLGFIKKSKPC